MAISPELRDSLQQIGDQIADKMKATLQRNNNDNTGRLSDSIKAVVTENGDIEFVMLKYGQWVNDGHERRAGKYPPIAPIRAWIKKQGILPKQVVTPKQLPYVIAASIAKRGQTQRKAYPFIEPAIQEVLNSDLTNDLIPAIDALFKKYKPQQ